MVKPKVLVITEEHHRRPRSIGGSSHQSNISYVTPAKHRSWHALFGNMNALQICEALNRMPYKPEGVKVVCEFINGRRVQKTGEHNSKNKNKIDKAWKFLFKNMTFTSAIHYINNVWLDPSYHFYIMKLSKK